MVSALNIKPPKTLFEVFVNLPQGTSAQLIDNNIVMSPAPLDLHQRIIVKIIGKLDRFIELKNLGECRIAPYDVFFDKKNVFQPDICFISKKNIQFIKATGCFGPPDLIIEVLSPSNSHFDLYEKKDVYERFGVNEYWIINPENNTTQGYTLQNGKYLSFYKGIGKLEFNLIKLKIKY